MIDVMFKFYRRYDKQVVGIHQRMTLGNMHDT